MNSHFRKPWIATGLCGLSLLAAVNASSPVFGQSSAKSAAAAAKADNVEPATVETAVKVLDLSKIPVPPNAKSTDDRHVGGLTYEVPADPKTAFEFHRSQLLKDGWKELPGGSADTSYSNAMFSKGGFTLSCTASANGLQGADAASYVSLMNLGNVPLKSLPVVKDAKSLFANEATAMYVTELSVPAATDQVMELLKKSGWEFYGRNDVSDQQKHLTVRKNAVQVSVMISTAPAQDNKTSIMFSSSLLPAEIPLPENATQSHFVSQTKTLNFQSPTGFLELAAFYQLKLAPEGWMATTEELNMMQDDFGRPIALQVFRNPAKDMITLNMQERDGLSDVTVRHQTLEEVKDEEKRGREAAQQLVAKRAEQEKLDAQNRKKAEMEFAEKDAEFDALANSLIADALSGGAGKPKAAKKKSNDKSVASSDDAVAVKVPVGTKVQQSSDNVLKLSVRGGKGKATAEFILGHLKADGWKAEDSDLDKTSGNVQLKRDRQRLTLTYVDTGLTDVNLMLIGISANLEASESDDAAKKN
jgi:hypothetical protein